MNCPSCDQKLPEGAPRCWNCGQLITGAGRGSGGIWHSPLVQLIAIVLFLSLSFGGAVLALGGVDLGTATASGAPSQAARLTPGTVTVRPQVTPAPSDAPGFHTVRVGETLYGIAFAYGVESEDLRYWNSDEFPSLRSTPQVVEGWVLKVVGPPRPTPSARPEPTPVLAGPTAPPQTGGGGSGTSGLVALPALSIDVPGASIIYYAIEGTNPNELISSGEANVKHPHGRAALAFVAPTTTFDWDYIVDPATGSCRVTSFSVARSYQITAPRWTAPAMVHPALLDWWSGLLDQVAWHEGQHVVIFERHFVAIEASAVGADCAAIQAIIDAHVAQMTADHAAFDASEADWGAQYPYTGPWDW